MREEKMKGVRRSENERKGEKIGQERKGEKIEGQERKRVRMREEKM